MVRCSHLLRVGSANLGEAKVEICVGGDGVKLIPPCDLVWGISVHMRIEEKISLTCGRDGGVQNMEILGMITLRVSDEKNGRIRLQVNNNDKKGMQLQVGFNEGRRWLQPMLGR